MAFQRIGAGEAGVTGKGKRLLRNLNSIARDDMFEEIPVLCGEGFNIAMLAAIDQRFVDMQQCLDLSESFLKARQGGKRRPQIGRRTLKRELHKPIARIAGDKIIKR